MMNDLLEETWQQLKTQRDEIKVQIHLAQAELKDELEALEPKWLEAQEKFEEIKQGTEETAADVQNAVKVVADELSAAYTRIKARLND
jgi:predicted  nucleic acid-binding Zn-ribbon protein